MDPISPDSYRYINGMPGLSTVRYAVEAPLLPAFIQTARSGSVQSGIYTAAAQSDPLADGIFCTDRPGFRQLL